MNERKPFVFEAVIFDLDGVITQTAVVHTKAWKKVFDAFLQKKAKENNIVFREFTQNDYLSYVDGKPRYQGVKSLLEARKVEIPWGTEDDGPDLETVC